MEMKTVMLAITIKPKTKMKILRPTRYQGRTHFNGDKILNLGTQMRKTLSTQLMLIASSRWEKQGCAVWGEEGNLALRQGLT